MLEKRVPASRCGTEARARRTAALARFAAAVLGFLAAGGLARAATVPATVFVSNDYSNTIAEYSSTGVDLGVFASTGLSMPQGLAFDAAGNLYAANEGTDSIEKFSPTGMDLGVFASTGMNYPCGIAFDSSGNLYVANWSSSTIEEYSPSGKDLGVFASAGLDQPAGLAFDSSGNLYAVNWGNSTIEKFGPSGGSGSTFASSSALDHPAGLAIDGSGNFYAASYWGTTVEKFSPTGADLGVFASGLSAPDGLAVDTAGNLYVANQNANTIVEVAANGNASVFASTGMDGPNFVAVKSPDFVKANNTTVLSQGASWVGGVAPGGASAVDWNNTVTGASSVLLGVDLSMGLIRIVDPGGAVTIGNDGHTLTLNGVLGTGIDMSSATQNLTINCPIALGSTQTFNVGPGVSLAANGGISGNFSLTEAGSGTLILAAANSFNGATLVSGGTLVLGSPLALQNSTLDSSGSGSVSFGSLPAATLGGLTGSGSLALSNASSAAVALSVGNNGLATTYSGALTGPGSLIKLGSNMLTLSCINSYAAGTTISGGTLAITNSFALGSGPITLAGGTLGFTLVPRSTSPGIGIHFVGGGNPVTGTAGVVPLNNWNNLSGTSFSGTPLTDSNGAATTAALSTTNALGVFASGSSNQLLNGYIFAVSGSLSATISGIPFSQYSLYAYMVDSTAGYSEEVTLAGKSYYFSPTNSASYLAIANTSSGSYPAGNYVLASGLSGGTQTVVVQGISPGFGSFAGFEIVNTSSTSGPLTLNGNPVTISADSAIDVTGPSSGAVTGQLTIGSNRLRLTGGGSGANTAYSLTLGGSGGILLSGNPTFDVANNGSGTGTLVLGALNDGGAARTITKSDVRRIDACRSGDRNERRRHGGRRRGHAQFEQRHGAGHADDGRRCWGRDVLARRQPDDRRAGRRRSGRRQRGQRAVKWQRPDGRQRQ